MKFTYTHMYYLLFLVTPLAGVWIEIQNPTACLWQENVSLPSRECGLKFSCDHRQDGLCIVTPLAGVWIEIAVTFYHALHNAVTPLAGVWIEIVPKACFAAAFTVTPLAGVWIEILGVEETFRNREASLPSRECGLKY